MNKINKNKKNYNSCCYFNNGQIVFKTEWKIMNFRYHRVLYIKLM